ncbi:membrane protein insertion efficiency factor YidD [Rhodopirellula europaea]|uniref:membrane protein insertion efficiency factor YidD n=1 Tax=Rhodopirellula europaea TaxID=1263866 RepID=UPI003D2692CA|tara:strand:+ start:4889 stop:5224 length:336 start_codon:yes stop_codon:yes gene_type:complete
MVDRLQEEQKNVEQKSVSPENAAPQDAAAESPPPVSRGFLSRLAISTMVLCIRWYQVVISPMMGPSCRFTPTCSAYAIESIQKHGTIRGTWRAIKRIGRCHPWNPGGYDPP